MEGDASFSDHGGYFKSPFQSCTLNAPPPPPLLVLHYNTAAGRVTNTVNLLFAGNTLQRGKAVFFPPAQ